MLQWHKQQQQQQHDKKQQYQQYSGNTHTRQVFLTITPTTIMASIGVVYWSLPHVYKAVPDLSQVTFERLIDGRVRACVCDLARKI